MQENKMGVMPVNRLIISMSLPIMISMLVQALYNIIDSIFVAMINEAALTAVSMAFPIQNLMIAVGVGTAVGVNALLARSLGEKDFEKEYLKDIKYYCLVMSETYIKQNFASIKKYANAIENRLDDEWCTIESVLEDNAQFFELAKKHGVNYVLIDDEYDISIDLEKL